MRVLRGVVYMMKSKGPSRLQSLEKHHRKRNTRKIDGCHRVCSNVIQVW